MTIQNLIKAVRDVTEEKAIKEFIERQLKNDDLKTIADEIQKGQRGNSKIFRIHYIPSPAMTALSPFQIRGTETVNKQTVDEIAQLISEDIKAGKSIEALKLQAIVVYGLQILDGNHTTAACLKAELEKIPVIYIPEGVFDNSTAFRVGMSLNRIENGVIRVPISAGDLDRFFDQDPLFDETDNEYIGSLALLFGFSVFSLGKARAAYIRRRDALNKAKQTETEKQSAGKQLKRWDTDDLKKICAPFNEDENGSTFASYTTSEAAEKGLGQFLWSMVHDVRAEQNANNGKTMKGVLHVYQKEVLHKPTGLTTLKLKKVIDALGLSDRIEIIELPSWVDFAKIEKGNWN